MRWLILLAALFAAGMGVEQRSGGLGQSPAAFAADSDRLLRVAGYAFAIWGPLYLGVIAHALWRLRPRGRPTALEARFAAPAVVAFTGVGLWIVAAALDAELLTIVLIVGAATALVWPLLAHADLVRAAPLRSTERWLTVWPLAALAGWLTVASPVNLLTVAAGNDALPPGPAALWPLLAVIGVAVLALAVTARVRTLAYGLPIAWGLAAVAVAEHARGAELLAAAAAGAASLTVVGGLILLGLRPRR